MAERDGYIDSAKFYLIIPVVASHAHFFLDSVSSLGNAMYCFVALFLIAAFISISGYFSKNITPRKFFKSTILLLETYLMLQIGFALYFDYPITFESVVLHPRWMAWFFLLLIFSRALGLLVNYLPAKAIYVVLALSLVVYFCTGIFPSQLYPMQVPKALSFLPYFLLGFMAPTAFWLKLQNIRHGRIFALLYLIVPIAMIYFFKPTLLQMVQSDFPFEHITWMNNGWLYLLKAFVLVNAILMSMCFFILIPRKPIRYTDYWGRRTDMVFFFHMFAIFAIGAVVHTPYYWVNMFIYTVFALVVTFAMSQYRISHILANPVSSLYYAVKNKIGEKG